MFFRRNFTHATFRDNINTKILGLNAPQVFIVAAKAIVAIQKHISICIRALLGRKSFDILPMLQSNWNSNLASATHFIGTLSEIIHPTFQICVKLYSMFGTIGTNHETREGIKLNEAKNVLIFNLFIFSYFVFFQCRQWYKHEKTQK